MGNSSGIFRGMAPFGQKKSAMAVGKNSKTWDLFFLFIYSLIFN